MFLLIALTLIPTLLLQGWIYYQHYLARRNQALQTELEVAHGVATTFTSYLDGLRHQLHAVGQAITTFDPYTDAKAEHLLGAVAQQYPTMRNLSWVSPQGLILASSLPDLVDRDLSHRTYFQQILAGQSWALGDLMPTGSVTETPIFVVASAIVGSEGALHGAIVAAIEPTRLSELTFPAQRPADGAYTIFDRQGQLVYRNPEMPLTWEQRSRVRQSDPLLRQALDSRIAQGLITSVIAGDRRVAARVPIADMGWVAGASRPMRVALGPVWWALIREAALGLLVTSFAFLVAYLIARTIADPLRRLEQQAQALGQGHLGPPVEPDGPEEVQRLHGTMTQMARDLIRRAEALRENEQRLRIALEAADLGVWDLDLTTDIATRSLRHDEIWGYRELQPQWGAETAMRQVLPEDRPIVQQAYARAREIGTLAFEARVRWPDGSIHWIAPHGRIHYDLQGRPVRITGVVADITERRNAEEQLRRYKLLSAHTRDILLFLRRDDGRILEANAAAVNAYGYSRDELLQMTIHDLRAPATEEQTLDQMAAADAQGILFETLHRCKDGSTFPVEVSSQGATIGGVRTLISVIRDITARKQTEEALRQSEQRLRRILEANPMGVVLGHEDGRVLEANDAYLRLIGYRREDLLSGRIQWDRITPAEYIPRDTRAIAQAKATGASEVYEKEYLRPDGSRVSVLLACAAMEGSELAAFVLDITGRKQAEEALRELNATLENRVARRTAELERRTRQLQELTIELTQAEDAERKRLAELLHDDLQQQLAAAKFHLGLLGRQIKGDASLREAMVQVEGLIKDAIDKSRRLSHELSPALLYHGDFGEALEWLAQQVQAKHGLVVHVEARGRVEVSSDAIKSFLFRTAQEILFNTVKHAQVTEATVRLRRRRGRLWLGVCDRGRGFDPQALGQSAGFGLLNIRERVELLGGRMKIRSAPGRGSAFLIAVPDAAPSPVTRLSPLAGDQRRQAKDTRSILRVLLVDDHEVMREGLAILLDEQEDIEVVGQAANGQEAVELTRELQPDVVVMDVAMPVMPGDEATRQIKQDMPRTRVVGLSMFDERAWVERMHQAGAERYMLKTAPSDELLAAIRDG